MIKKSISVLAVASTLLMASCSSEPSDLRPETKVSDDYVPPGMRNNTSNIDNSRADDEVTQPDVQLNHDEHANEIKKEAEGVPASQKPNNASKVENHR